MRFRFVISLVFLTTIPTFASQLYPGKVYKAYFQQDLQVRDGIFQSHSVIAETEMSIRFFPVKLPNELHWTAEIQWKTAAEGFPISKERIVLAGDDLSELTGPTISNFRPKGEMIQDRFRVLRINEDDSINAHYYYEPYRSSRRALQVKSFNQQIHLELE